MTEEMSLADRIAAVSREIRQNMDEQSDLYGSTALVDLSHDDRVSEILQQSDRSAWYLVTAGRTLGWRGDLARGRALEAWNERGGTLISPKGECKHKEVADE